MLEKLPLKITRIGLIGFGKTGKAVANVILQCKEFRLEWVLRQRNLLGVESDHPGLIYSTSNTELETLINKHPVDIIIDFSSENGIYTYFDIAQDRGIKIISAVSHYEEKELEMLSILAKSNVVFWSPNITLGVNYLLFAAKF